MSDQDNYFSSQYQYKIKKTSDENQGRYQLGDYWLIQYHILRCNIRRLVEQTVRRITNDILGVKGLSGMIIYVYFLTMVMKGICFLKHTSPLMCVTITKRFYSNQRKLGYELFLFCFFF